MAWDVDRHEWAGRLLDAADVTADVFPRVRAPGSAVGDVPELVTRRLGLPGVVVFATGGLDQAAATLGAGLTEPGEAMVGSGSWEALTTLTPRDAAARRVALETLAASGISLGPSVVPGHSMAMATQAGGGSLLEWLRSVVAPRRSVAALIAAAPDRVTGMLVLPHVEGSYSPWMDPSSRGAIAGIGIATTRGELVRAALEGITLELRLNVERMAASGIEIGALRNTGGGSRSPAWVQLKADVLGRSVTLVDVQENAAFGAALLAGQAAHVFGSASAAARELVHVTRTVETRPAMVAAYDEVFGRYRELYPALSSARLPPAQAPGAAAR